MVEASSSARTSLRSLRSAELCGQKEELEDFYFKIACLDNPKGEKTKFDCLEISGNPTKWLNKGHNLWGTDNIEMAIEQYIKEVLAAAGITLSDWERNKVDNLEVYPQRIDLTSNIRCDGEGEALRLTEAMANQSKSKYQAARGYGTSAYFGEKSKVKTTVFYKKRDEFVFNWKKVNKDDKDLIKHYDLLYKETEGLVRYEHRLKTQWFRKRNLNTLRKFLNIKGDLNIMENNLEQLNLGQMDISDEEVNRIQAQLFEQLEGLRIRNSIISTFKDWKLGENVEASMARNTYFKHKKMIKNLTGLDISNPRRKAEFGKVVPLITYVTGQVSAPSNEYKQIMFG